MQAKQGCIAKFRFFKIGVGLVVLMLAATHALGGIITYSATNFTARWQNDGGFTPAESGSITLMLTNNPYATFTGANGQDLIGLGYVVPSNIPSGLTATAIRTSASNVVLTLGGLAVAHTTNANINNLSFNFLNAAFGGGSTTSGIVNISGTNISICYLAQVQSNWYVNGSTGLETNNGTNSTTPFKSITNAIAHAQSSANDIINIATGTYIQAQITVGSKILTFNGLGSNPSTTIVEPNPNPGMATNASVFVLSTHGAFNNLTIQNGAANGGGAGVYQGGGGSDITVNNCVFANNMATNTGAGGAILHGSVGTYTIVLNNSTFTNNSSAGANGGGALSQYSGYCLVSNCVFAGNATTNSGGAIWFSAPTFAGFTNTLFINNVALNGSAGAVASYNSQSGTIMLNGCTLANNTAGTVGGAVNMYQGWVTAINSTFVGNHSSQNGGCLYQQSNTGTFGATNCTFYGNSASLTGGCAYSSQPVLLNSSIMAGDTAGIVSPEIYSSGSSCLATNSLIGTTNGMGGSASAGCFKYSWPGTNAAGNYIGNALTNAVPGLNSLAQNYATLPTCALQPTSVAIHHGANPLGLLYDERGPGFSRTNTTASYAGQTDMGAYEFGAGAPRFIYSATLWNGLANGAIITTNQITLGEGIDAFAGTNNVTEFVASGWLVVSNCPSSLTVTALQTSSTNLNVTMTGNAGSLAAVSNLTFVFQPGALVTDHVMTDAFNYAVTNLQLLFAQGTPSLTYSGTIFTESGPNNGAIGNSISITIANDSFNGTFGEEFVGQNKVTVTNVPNGLTVQLVLNDSNKKILTASLIGNALYNNASNDISNLTFAFTNSAFQSSLASAVSNAVVSNLQIQYLNPSLTYSSKTFNESWMNDGSIANTISASLAGDSFNGSVNENFVTSGKVTPVNVPAGLTAQVTMTTTQTLTIALLGNASPNTSAQNVSNLGFTFANNAFACNAANIVTNYNESDLAVAFLSQNPSNWYVSTSGVDTNVYTGLATNQAFRTIRYALTRIQANANDTINLLPGTYSESNLTINANVVISGHTPNDTFIQPWPTPFNAPNLGIFAVAASNLTLENVTLQYGNQTNGYGGAIVCADATSMITINGCCLNQNAAPSGGAIGWNNNNTAGATLLSLYNSLLSSNQAAVSGGAIFNNMEPIMVSNCVFVGNIANTNATGGLGGAIYQALALTVFSSSFISNSAASGGAVDHYCTSGSSTLGTYSNTTFAFNNGTNTGGAFANNQSVETFVGCTLYGNTATNGGAVYFFNNGSGTLIVDNSTIFSNSAGVAGGGINVNAGVFSLSSTILAGNSAPTGPDALTPNCADSYVLIGNDTNLTGVATGQPNANHSYIGASTNVINSMLLPLANNGGPMLSFSTWPLTMTCAIASTNSLAYTHGTNSLGLLYDERGVGYARTNSLGKVDIGAYEYGSQPPPTPVKGTMMLFW